MKTAVNEALMWEYLQPAPLNTRLLLLTKHNTAEVGPWKGAPMPDNKTYKAWHALPARDLSRESLLGYR